MVLFAVFAGFLYAVFAVTMYKCQHRLVYRIDSRFVSPGRVGLADIEDVTLSVPGGDKLVAWYGAARPGRPTILYLHGQAGNLARRADRIRRYQALGVGVLIVAYRGFSGSTGQPGEAANVADALFAYDWLLARGVLPRDIVVYGESLGTGVAGQVAAARNVSGLVLDSPFTSLGDLAAQRHPLLPVRRFMSDRYETMTHITKVTAPVLVLHGEMDPIVPMAMGARVFAAVPGAKRLVSFPEGRHLDHGRHGSYGALLAFLNDRAHLPADHRKVERVLQKPIPGCEQATDAEIASAARA